MNVEMKFFKTNNIYDSHRHYIVKLLNRDMMAIHELNSAAENLRLNEHKWGGGG